ncbi:glycosyl transferase family 9 (putative heptosyltransferase) [Roseiarcus fermentans]|uniref:Glycosyl transferase family 9 (Putative heptosyltransferase) n=1 Tax=Roseiarcus fermentans TaxID=1473586 RepID=A0A366FX49_9HYPH|nr:glycosyltransferase family 9 protein [Roseiarcus fermentans]RBP18315.1 glycosyl transferase family 9 (putative heptosyltransferase) [Roseiarcus fermentans]
MLMQGREPPVLISPFANERVRQWPWQHYRKLIEMIVREHGHSVAVVGTRAQRAAANAIVRDLSSEMVSNACGMWSWAELVAAVDAAPYVVANNSGVAHLAGGRGRWTLCIFAASHAYSEWMPRGPRVVTLTKALACSPCSVGGERCYNGVACMIDFEPAEVFWCFNYARNAAAALG